MTNKTILVVDDEDFIRRMVVKMLSYAGYDVVTADCGEQAVELLRERGRGIDLIILDLMMPGMGGRKTFEAVKALGHGLKIVIASGFGREGDVQEMLSRGADGFLPKPFVMDELLAEVRKVLDIKE